MSNVKTRSCPKCGFNLVFQNTNQTVICECCEQEIAWDTDRFSASDDTAASTTSMTIPALMGFDNPESGIVFVENFFDNYDWNAYIKTSDIKIGEITEVVNNNKMKNGACAISWYLDYKALAYPLRKKIEGLAKHQQKMGELYNPEDPTESLTTFDTYQRICKALNKGKTDFFKQLENAIKYAEKFNLDTARMGEIKNDYAALKAIFDKEVVIVEDISEIAAYDAAKKAASKKIAEELATKGVDAAVTYEQAMSLYEGGAVHNQLAALPLFEKVRGYEDSVRIIAKINQYFNFKNEMYRAFGSHFIYKQEEYNPSPLDVKNLGKKVKNMKKKAADTKSDAPTVIKAWSLFEVVDGKPAKESSIQGIDKLITCYGGRLYYFKTDEGIFSYDITTHAEAAICKGKTEHFKFGDDYEYRVATNGSTFFVKKLITKEEEEETGCSKILSKFQKKQVVEEDELNLYTVLAIDMKNNSCKPIINKMTAVAETYENKIFYTVREKQQPVKMGCVEKLKGKKAKDPEIITRLMVCDTDTGACKQALDSSCDVNSVYKNYIVYSVQTPNNLNKDLYSLNLTTGEKVLIESNIFNYYDLIDGKVYYTVGNSEFQPLARNNLEGTERLEIMTRVAKIICERGGYLYVERGSKYSRSNKEWMNNALWKIKTDGSMSIPLCSQFWSIAKFEDNDIYYVDVFGSLHVMRVDGKNDRVLADKVTEVATSSKGLYYVRREPTEGRKKAFSLYLMDKGGKNVKKVAFNLVQLKEDTNAGIITYSKEEKIDFKVYLPKKEDEAVIQSHDITRYYEMDKETGDTKLVLTMGWPEDEDKQGCLTKFIKPKKHIYEEYSIPKEYTYYGLHPDSEDEQTFPDPEEDEGIMAISNALSNANLPAGCANILKTIKSKVNPNNGGKQSAGKSKLRTAKTSKATKSSKAKRGNPKAALYLLLVLIIALPLILFIPKLFNRSHSAKDSVDKGYKNAHAIYVDQEYGDYVSSDGSVWYEFEASKSGEYTLSARADKGGFYVYVYDSNPKNSSYSAYNSVYSGDTLSMSYYFDSGRTYWIQIKEFYGYGTDFYLKINSPEDGRTSATAYTIDGVYYSSVSSSDYVWFKYTAQYSGQYDVMVNANSDVSLYWWDSNPEYNGYLASDYGTNPYTSWYLEEGRTYWFKVSDAYVYTDFSINVNFLGH